MHCSTESYTTGLMVCKGVGGDEVAFNCPKPHDAYLATGWPEAWKWQTVVCGTMIRGAPRTAQEYWLVLHAAWHSPAIVAVAMFTLGLAAGLLIKRLR